MIDAKEGGLFRSNDAGATWTKTTGDTRIWGRGWYFEKVAVDPKNPDVVYVPNVGIQRSTDGGKTFSTWAMRGSPGGDDYQGVWISPDDPNVVIAASDQGAIITLNASAETPTWSSWLNQPTAQIYHVSADYSLSVLGDRRAAGQRRRARAHARQVRRDLDARLGAALRRRRERLPPPPIRCTRASLYGGTVTRCNLDLNGKSGELAPPAGPRAGRDSDWTQPLVFSKADPRVLYYRRSVSLSHDHRRRRRGRASATI